MIRRGELKTQDGIGYDEWRECHYPGCRAKFRPSITVSGESSEYHCSPECAAACLAARGFRVAP
jgi:hypothetical protein